MKKMLAVMLIMAVAIFSPVSSLADDDISIIYSATASSFFSSYGISLSKSGTTVHISFRVTALQTMDQLGVLIYDVQRLVNGSWTTVGNDLTGSIGSDRVSYSFSKNYYAVSGYSYRVQAKFYAKKYDGSGETVWMSSSSISV